MNKATQNVEMEVV